jgi:hypothetical protein
MNAASDRLLAGVFDSLGMSEEQRNRIVDSMLDWRDADDIPHLYGAEVGEYDGRTPPRNGAFQSVDELLQVKNMTPQLFYGTVSFDPVSGKYERIPGVRELLTVQSGSGRVQPNVASREVLLALPGMTPPIVDTLIEQRTAKRFADSGDLQSRVPMLVNNEAMEHLSFDAVLPTMLVARATIHTSGVSRSVRLLFRREQKIQYLTFAPLVFRRVNQITFDRWQYQ